MRDAGHVCGRERVRRLMRDAALRARPRSRALPTDTEPRPLHKLAPHPLDREFTALAPDQKWVADSTYTWTAESRLYCAAVLDLYWRRIVGWSMQATMTAQLVTDALVTAAWRRGSVAAESLLRHSDQGSQYASEGFQRQLAELEITCSMSRSGNVWDNAVLERFFSTLKTERCHRRRYASRDEARADSFDYVERFYNPIRRHSTLGNRRPVASEQAGAVAVAELTVHGSWRGSDLVHERDVHVCVTVEGNTNDDGSANGHSTLRKVRAFREADGHRFVRWAEMVRRAEAASLGGSRRMVWRTA